MKTPVLIPACNEARLIAGTLQRLPGDLVEPIVAVNGSNDETASIARGFGCQVLEFTDPGKLPAIQETLKSIGNHAMEPLLILDADTRPIFPRQWALRMTSSLNIPHTGNRPSAVGGPAIYTGRSPALCALRSSERIVRSGIVGQGSTIDTLMSGGMKRAAQFGPNMGLFLRREDVLDDVLALDNFWPSEDRAMAAVVLNYGGTLLQPINPGVVVLSPASLSFPTVIESIKFGKRRGREEMFRRYAERGTPGSVPFSSEVVSGWEYKG